MSITPEERAVLGADGKPVGVVLCQGLVERGLLVRVAGRLWVTNEGRAAVVEYDRERLRKLGDADDEEGPGAAGGIDDEQGDP